METNDTGGNSDLISMIGEETEVEMVQHEEAAEGGTTASVEAEDRAATGWGTAVRAVASGGALLGRDVTGEGTLGESAVLDTSLADENPWPYLSSFFKMVTKKDKNLTFECILCQPKKVLIKAHASTLTNLRSHTQRFHENRFVEFGEDCKQRSGRGKFKRGSSPGSETGSEKSQPAKRQVRVYCSS